MTTVSTTKHTLVIIDSAIDDHQILVQGIKPTAKVTVLNKHQDGIAQISALCKNHPAASIQIIAHGSPGNLQLSNSHLNLDTLPTYSQQLQQWQAAEILIYGCEVAAGESGKTFIEQLHQLTKANIAASAQKIGNTQQGGTWELEVKLGQIASTLALAPEIRETYPGVLATFATTNFTVDGNRQSVTVGDFNSDGKLDLAAANLASNNVSVLLGTGTGSFATATNFTVGSGPISVTVGDFNSDGKLDLAAANLASNNVSVLLGTGTGSFATATNFTVGSGPISVTVGDFNSDGKLDLAAANLASNNVSVLLGTGTGSFATATNFTVGSGPISVTVGDFNSDGKLDLAAANLASNDVSVLLGTGTGGFAPATYFSAGSRPISVTVGDFNSDGKLDLATANNFSDTVSVLLGTGTGGFASATNFTGGNSPRSVTVADVNSDGKLDLAVANTNGGTVFVLLNTTPKITIAPGTNPTEGVTVGSFTITLDTPAPDGGLIVNFNTTGTATPTTDYTLAAGTNITAITANTFAIAAGATTATLTVTAVTDASDPNETLTVNLESSPDYILGANSTANFQPATNFTVGSGPMSVTVGDFNSDGNLDLAAANYFSDTVSVLLGTGTGGFATATTFTVGSRPRSVTVGDFNSDGNLDLAAANYFSDTVSVLLGTGTGGFATATTFTVGSRPRSVTVGDFNSDGNLDLAAANSGNGTVSVLLGNGTGGFATATNFTVGSGPMSVTVGDFNSDGKLDLAAANSGNGTVSVLLGTGTGGFATATNFTVGSGPYSVTVGDFNGDGKLDLAAANSGSNNVSVLLNVTSATLTIAEPVAPVTSSTTTTVTYTENDPATIIDSGITVTDVDSQNLSSATVTITTGLAATEDILAFTPQNGITSTYTNGVLSLTGSATVAQYQTALRSVTYQNTSDNPSTTARTISFVVNDGTLDSTAKTYNIDIAPVNDAPVTSTTTTTVTYTENDPATIIDSGITVTDVDSQNLSSATVTITTGLAATEDILAFTPQNGITSTYTNGVLSLTGSATVAQYQTALRSVTYQNTSDNPNTTRRTISFVVNDGSLDSSPATRDIDLTAVNDAPTDLALSNTNVDENVAANTVIGTFSSTDPDTGNTFTYSLVTGTGDVDNNAFTIDGSNLKINASPNFEAKSSYNIRVKTQDAGKLFYEKPLTITIKDVNEAPTDLTLSNTNVDENVAANTVIGTFSSTDPDTGNTFTYSLVTGTGDVDNNAFTIDGSNLKINASPNFEAKSSYNIRVKTQDAGGLFYEKPLTITIKDVNEAPTDLALSNTDVSDKAAANTVIGTFSSIDPDKDDNFVYSLVSGIDDVDNNAFIIDGNSLKIKDSPDFKTKSSYKIRVRTTDDGDLTLEKGLTINVNDGSKPITKTDDIIPSRLTNPSDDVFNIQDKDAKVKIKLEITLTERSSKLLNELGLFTVDDAKGTINGIAPGAAGYAQAALERSKVIFSTITNAPNGFNPNNISSLLELNSGDNLRFLFVKNSTFDAVRTGATPISDLVFSSVSTQKITALGGDSFYLA